MDKTQKTAFVDYCFDFYGDKGIYDLKFTKEEIEKGLDARINDTKGILREYEKPLSTIPFDGDSIDREMVRDIVLIQKVKRLGKTTFHQSLTRKEMSAMKNPLSFRMRWNKETRNRFMNAKDKVSKSFGFALDNSQFMEYMLNTVEQDIKSKEIKNPHEL